MGAAGVEEWEWAVGMRFGRWMNLPFARARAGSYRESSGRAVNLDSIGLVCLRKICLMNWIRFFFLDREYNDARQR